MRERTESGWGKPLLAKKWHYFARSTEALCGKWVYGGTLHPEPFAVAHPCEVCRARLAAKPSDAGAA